MGTFVEACNFRRDWFPLHACTCTQTHTHIHLNAHYTTLTQSLMAIYSCRTAQHLSEACNPLQPFNIQAYAGQNTALWRPESATHTQTYCTTCSNTWHKHAIFNRHFTHPQAYQVHHSAAAKPRWVNAAAVLSHEESSLLHSPCCATETTNSIEIALNIKTFHP